MNRFEHDTTVTAAGPGRYEATIDTGWWIIAGPNGGYIAAIVARAIVAEIADPALTLRSLTLHYLRPPAEGPVVIDVVVERRGRSVATVTARMSQNDSLLVIAVAAVAAPRETPAYDDTVAPEAPAPEDVASLVRTADQPGIPLNERYEMRPCLGSATEPWVPGAPPMPAETGGWIRFSDPAPIDAVALTAISDGWWPPLFHRLPDQMLAVPTIDLTVHVIREPDDPHDWVLARFASPLAHGGYLIENGDMWDRHGNLLAVVRQLAVIV